MFTPTKRKRLKDPEAKRPKKLRSGFEAKVKKSLESRGIEFKYESEKLRVAINQGDFDEVHPE